MAIDKNDGKEWSDMDLADLTDALARGKSIAEAAAFLCRSGSVDDVARKAIELHLPDKFGKSPSLRGASPIARSRVGGQ